MLQGEALASSLLQIQGQLISVLGAPLQGSEDQRLVAAPSKGLKLDGWFGHSRYPTLGVGNALATGVIMLRVIILSVDIIGKGFAVLPGNPGRKGHAMNTSGHCGRWPPGLAWRP